MMSDLLARVVGVPETRSTAQVRREVDEEFSHHQGCLRDELRRLGVPESELEARVGERFGDAHRLADACTRIALKERIMLQRINFALLLVVGIAVAWTAWNMEQSSAKSTLALEKMAQRLEAIGSARTAAPNAAVVESRTSGYVTVRGHSAERPGLYSIPSAGR